MNINSDEIYESLNKTINSYFPISDTTWEEFKKICEIRVIKKK